MTREPRGLVVLSDHSASAYLGRQPAPPRAARVAQSAPSRWCGSRAHMFGTRGGEGYLPAARLSTDNYYG